MIRGLRLDLYGEGTRTIDIQSMKSYALLGVGEEDLYLDYELSFLSQSGCADFKEEITPNTFLGDHLWSLYHYIDHYKEEGTLSEKTEQFMLDIGITSEEIASIKAIMLEDVES